MSATTKRDAEFKTFGDHELEHVSGGAGASGIDYLIMVTQLKADNANNEALGGASKQTGSSHWYDPRTW